MPKSFLIFDVNYMCYRAFYSTGELSYHDIKTGVVFGVLRDITNLQDSFLSSHLVFCFDHGRGIRKDMWEGYKKKRHERQHWDADKWKAYEELQSQMYLLRTLYLKQIGYRNVFSAEGYESDDCIASVIHRNVSDQDSAVIISADKDLYQLIQPNVVFHNPTLKKTVTDGGFRKLYGIAPRRWAHVLSIAGCKTDEVTGIPDVGTKTAAKYLRGDMNEESFLFRRITGKKGSMRIARNLPLVKLPLDGTPQFKMQQDEVTSDGWRAVMAKLGVEWKPKTRRPTLWD